MKNNFHILLLALVAISFYACLGNKKETATDSAVTTASAKQPIDTADARLAKDLSNFCTSQIEAAQLAETKASTKKVKAFAKENVKIYTELSNHLNSIAEEYAIKLPAEPLAMAKENIQKLSAIKEASFDHAYLLQMLKDHNAMIRENNAAKNIHCMPLKIFVGSNQAVIIKQAYAISDLKDKTP